MVFNWVQNEWCFDFSKIVTCVKVQFIIFITIGFN